MTLQCKGLAVACSNAAVRRLCSNQKTRSSESIHGLCERTESFFFSRIVYLYKSEKSYTSKDFQSLFVTKYCYCAQMGYTCIKVAYKTNFMHQHEWHQNIARCLLKSAGFMSYTCNAFLV